MNITKPFPLIIVLLAITLVSTAQLNDKPIFVIVHGAWGGGWAFKKVDSLMTAHGYKVYRPTLTGQGEHFHLSNKGIDLTTHINDIVNMILFEDLHDIVLVGHSYGGMVVTGVADRIPDRIHKLIYVDAMLPINGENVLDVWPVAKDLVPATVKDSMIVPSWVSPKQSFPGNVPQPLKTFTERIVLKNAAAANIPTTYILTVDPGKKAEDDSFYFSYQRAIKRGWKTLQMTADHNPQWSKPEELVGLLEANR